MINYIIDISLHALGRSPGELAQNRGQPRINCFKAKFGTIRKLMLCRLRIDLPSILNPWANFFISLLVQEGIF